MVEETAAAKRDARFLEAFMTVWEVHKKDPPTDSLKAIYIDNMVEFSIKQIEYAFKMALDNLNWFPKPAELRKFIKVGPGDIEDIAMVEADKVIKAIRTIGHRKSIKFDNQITQAVISQAYNGWITICELPTEEHKWFRIEFIKIFKAYLTSGIKKDGHLVGQIEDDNQNRFPNYVPPAVIIGDQRPTIGLLNYKKIEVDRENNSKTVEIPTKELKNLKEKLFKMGGRQPL